MQHHRFLSSLCLSLLLACGTTEPVEPPPQPPSDPTEPTAPTQTEPTTSADSADTDETLDTDVPEPTIWSGPSLFFEKVDYADPTDPANQDAMTPAVVLTRGPQNSLFNVVLEDSASSSSPEGTEWSKGTTAELDSLTFDTLKGATNNQMSSLPGTSLVAHLIEENIYLDVTFVSWTSGEAGGGFSYERSTP